mgnify:CR=1 FL=1
MADIAAVLDSAGLAGLGIGKKDGKASGEELGQAGFISVLLSQMATGSVPKGKAVNLVELFKHPNGAGAGTTVQSSPLISSFQDVTKSLVADTSRYADGIDDTNATDKTIAPKEAGASTEASGAQPVPASPLVTAIQAATSDVAQQVQESGSESGKTSSAASRATIGELKNRVSDLSKQVGNPPALSANAADDSANNGQDLPVPGAEMLTLDPDPLQAQAENMANISTSAQSATLPTSSDASALRPFEQTLRQIESRLNVSVEAHVKSPAFAGEFANKVVWLAGRQGQVAELTLNPPQLGAVEIRLSMAGGEAGAQFFSANPAVRDAIEAALPKLRELMSQAGINLGEANVRDQSFSQGKGAERPEVSASALPGSIDMAVAENLRHGAVSSGGLGLVDLYA